MKETLDGSCYRTITTRPFELFWFWDSAAPWNTHSDGNGNLFLLLPQNNGFQQYFPITSQKHESIMTKEGPDTQIEIHVSGSTEPKNLIAGSGDQILLSGRKRLDCSKWKVMKSSGGAGGGIWPCLKINPMNGVTERLWLEQMPHKYWNPLFFKEIGPNSMRGRHYSAEQNFPVICKILCIRLVPSCKTTQW